MNRPDFGAQASYDLYGAALVPGKDLEGSLAMPNRAVGKQRRVARPIEPTAEQAHVVGRAAYVHPRDDPQYPDRLMSLAGHRRLSCMTPDEQM